MNVLACTVQVSKPYKQLLHPCDVVHAVNHSTSPVGFLKRRLYLKTPPIYIMPGPMPMGPGARRGE